MSDEIIREVRRIRHLISQECGHDVRKIAEYYRTYEEELKRSGKYRFADPRERERVEQEPESAESAAS
jgi:hypothetical protein